MRTMESKFVGYVFGDFKVLKISEEQSKGKRKLIFECQCLNCGAIEYKDNDAFNKTKCLCRKCNKNWDKRNTNPRYKDYLNQKIGHLYVLEHLGVPQDNNRIREWRCLCDCGNECIKTSNYLHTSVNAMCPLCYSNFLSEKTHKSCIKKVAKECSVEYFDDYAIINNVSERFNNEDKIIVDHINGDRTDNRKSNLRVIEKKYNSINCKTYKNNSTGRKGVHWNKKLQKWTASIQKNHINKFLGVFENYDDAVKAREQAEDELFGEFKRIEA